MRTRVVKIYEGWKKLSTWEFSGFAKKGGNRSGRKSEGVYGTLLLSWWWWCDVRLTDSLSDNNKGSGRSLCAFSYYIVRKLVGETLWGESKKPGSLCHLPKVLLLSFSLKRWLIQRRRRRCRWLGRGARFCICSRFLLRGVEDCTNWNKCSVTWWQPTWFENVCFAFWFPYIHVPQWWVLLCWLCTFFKDFFFRSHLGFLGV